ncbi:MAG: DUF4905 domain-containing protein [Cytophagales bacterium]|nr:DUF4905 domain-containing protein [Cytophagales bacterium]MDW8384549.1 DUF4905 domain-containing protein [Flammeovirgaceae bacterium]
MVFSLFENRKKKFQIPYDVGEKKQIWKLHIDFFQPNHLIVETRKNGEIFCTVLDIQNQTILQPEFALPTDWYCSISQIANHVMFITRYEGTHNPIAASIIAFDIENQKILWEKLKAHFVEAQPEVVCIIQNEAISWLETKSGKTTHKPSQFSQKKTRVILPQHYLQSDEYFTWIKDFLKTKCIEDIVGAIDYWEDSHTFLISYYQPYNQQLTNYLSAFDKHGNELWSYLLQANLKGISDETFFIMNQNVIFVQNKRFLYVKKLP